MASLQTPLHFFVGLSAPHPVLPPPTTVWSQCAHRIGDAAIIREPMNRAGDYVVRDRVGYHGGRVEVRSHIGPCRYYREKGRVAT